jgi:hypothetical protein
MSVHTRSTAGATSFALRKLEVYLMAEPEFVEEFLKVPRQTMKPPPADRAADPHEGLEHVGALVEPRPQAAELVQQRNRLLHDVTEHSQAAAVAVDTPA